MILLGMKMSPGHGANPTCPLWGRSWQGLVTMGLCQDQGDNRDHPGLDCLPVPAGPAGTGLALGAKRAAGGLDHHPLLWGCCWVRIPLGHPHGDEASRGDRALLGGQRIVGGGTPSSSGDGKKPWHLDEVTDPHVSAVTGPSGPFSCICPPLKQGGMRG